MKDKVKISLIWAVVFLVALTVTVKLLVDGNIRVTEIRELQK